MMPWTRFARWFRARSLRASGRGNLAPLPPPEGSRLMRQAIDELARSQGELHAAIKRPPGVVPPSRNAIANVIAQRGEPS